MVGGIIFTVIGIFLLLVVLQYYLVDSKMSRDGIKSNAPSSSIAAKPAKAPLKMEMNMLAFAVGGLGVVLIVIGLYKLGLIQLLFARLQAGGN